MPADVMQELIGANEGNTNGTRDVVANAIKSIQSMPDCENLVKSVLKATTGFESLAEAAKHSGKSTSDILDRVAFVFEKITSRAAEAQASVYGFGSSFGKIRPDSLSVVEKRLQGIKNQFDLTSASLGAFSRQFSALGNGASRNGSQPRAQGAEDARLSAQEQTKLRNIARFLDMNAASMFRKTLSMVGGGSSGRQSYARTGVQYDRCNASLATSGGTVKGVDRHQDSQLAFLRPGEFVVPKNQMQQFRQLQKARGYELGGVVGDSIRAAHGSAPSNPSGEYQKQYLQKLQKLFELQKKFDDNLDDKFYSTPDIPITFPTNESDAKKAAKNANKVFDLLMEEIRRNAVSDTRNDQINGSPIPSVHISESNANRISGGFSQLARASHSSESKKSYAYVGRQIKQNQGSSRATGAVLRVAQQMFGSDKIKGVQDLLGLDEDDIKEFSEALQDARDIIEDAKNTTSQWSDVFENLDEEADEFAKHAIGGMGVLGKLLKGNLVGTMAKVGAFAILGKAISDAFDSMADFAPKLAEISVEYTKMQQSVATLSGEVVNFEALRNELTLTKEEAAQLGEAYQKVAMNGINSVQTVTAIARSMKETMGKVDISTLRDAVDLIESLPKEQVNVLISGVGTMDDKANLIANLMEDGNLDRVIKLQMSGAFGQQEGMPQLSERDKAVIDAQQEANKMLEDMKMLLYEHLPGIAWSSAIVGSKMISIVAKFGAFLASSYITAKAALKLGRSTNGFAVRTHEVGAKNLPSGKVFKYGFNRRGLSRGVLKVAGRTEWGRGLARTIAGHGAKAVGKAATHAGGTAVKAGAATGGTAGAGIMATVGPALLAGVIAYAISKPIAYFMEKHAKKLRNKYEAEKAMERAKNEAFYGNALGRDAYDDVRSVKIAGVEGAAKGLVIGATSGAMVGALMGSVVPGIGTVVGGAIGGLIGAIGGSFAGKWLNERDAEMKGAFYRDRKRKWSDYVSGTSGAEDTVKTKIVRTIGGAIAPFFGSILADLLFGDSHARENTDLDETRKKYYDRMFDRLDDLNMALSGQVLLGEDGKPVVTVDENEKDSSGRPVRKYTAVDEFGNIKYDAWGKPIQITIEDFRKQQMKKLVELNKNVKQLEFIVKDKYTQFNQQLVKAGLANLESMSTVGGTNENFGKAVKLVSSQATRAYTTKLDKLNELKLNALNNHQKMDPEYRANLMAKIMQDEVKVHKDYIDTMMEVIGKLGEMPEVMVHDIKAGIVRAFADWKSESFSGTAGSAIQDSMAQVSETMQSSTDVFNQHLEDLRMLEETSKKVEESIAKIDEEIAKREKQLGLSVSQAEEIQEFYKDRLAEQRITDEEVAAAQLADLADVVEPIFKEKNGEPLRGEDASRVSETIPQMIAIARSQIDRLDPVEDKERIKQLKELIKDLEKTQKSVEAGVSVNLADDTFQTLNLLQTQVTDRVRQAQNNARFATEQKYGTGSYGHSMEMLALQAMKTGASDNKVENAKLQKQAQEKYLEQLKKQSDSFVAAITNAFENGAKKFADAMASIAEKTLRYKQTGAGGENAVAEYYRRNRESAFAGMDAAREAEKLLPEYAKKTEEMIGTIPEVAAKEGWGQNEADYALTFGRLQQARQRAFQNPDDIDAMMEVSRLEAELNARGASVSTEFLQSNAWKALEAQLSITSKAFETFAQQLADSKVKVMQAWEAIPDMIEKVLNNAEYAIARRRASAAAERLEYNNKYVDGAYAFKHGDAIARLANQAADLNLEGEQKAYEQAMAEAQKQYESDRLTDAKGAQNRFNETIAKLEEEHYKKRGEIQRKRLEEINKVFDAKMGALNRRTEALEIQKDVLETIGAPFEYIVGIEQEMVRASKAKAAIEEERLQAMIDGGVQGEALEEQKLKVAKAQAQVIKDAFGAQRDSLDKMLGKIMGTFNEVGGIFGPDGAYAQVRKMGQGYVTNAQTGLNWAAGDTTITGYANRVATTTGAIAGHQLPNGGYGWGGRGGGMANGGTTATIGYGRITQGTHTQGDVDTFVTPSNRVINANNYEWVINAEDFENFASAYGLTEDQLFAKMRKHEAPGCAYGGPTNMSLSDALKKNKKFYQTAYDDTDKPTYEDLVQAKIQAYEAVGAYNLNPNVRDAEVFNDKGEITKQKNKSEITKQKENRYKALVGKNLGKRDDGISAKNDTSGEASAQLVDEMTRKTSGTGALDNTGDAPNAKGPGGKATQGDKILLEILKDTHRIIELMGGKADWDTIKELEEKQKNSDAKNEGNDLSKNEERNKYFAENIDPSLAGKSTAEMESELDKLVNTKGERDDDSFKRQRNLESAVLYDKLFSKKKEMSTNAKGSLEQSLDVQKEILKYVKLIYELLAGTSVATANSNATGNPNNPNRTNAPGGKGINWDDTPFKAPVARPVQPINPTPVMVGMFGNPSAFVNQGASPIMTKIIRPIAKRVSARFSRAKNWFRTRFGRNANPRSAPSGANPKATPKATPKALPQGKTPKALPPPKGSVPPPKSEPMGRPITPSTTSTKTVTLNNGATIQAPSAWDMMTPADKAKWIKLKTLENSATGGESNAAAGMASRLEAKYANGGQPQPKPQSAAPKGQPQTPNAPKKQQLMLPEGKDATKNNPSKQLPPAEQSVPKQLPPGPKKINFRQRVNNFLQSTKGKTTMTALSWLPVGMDAYHAITADTARERNRGIAHATIDSLPALAATAAIWGGGRLAQGAGAMVAPLLAAAEMGKTAYDMGHSNDETMEARLDEWMGRSVGDDIMSYGGRALAAGAAGAAFGGPLGAAVGVTTDFVGHAGSDIIETYGLNKYLERRSNQINNASAEQGVRSAQARGIDENEFNKMVHDLLESEEGKAKLAQYQKQEKENLGWGSNFAGNLLTLGAQNRTGQANAQHSALKWAQMEAQRRLAKHPPISQNPKPQPVQAAPAQQTQQLVQSAPQSVQPAQETSPKEAMREPAPEYKQPVSGNESASTHQIREQQEFGKTTDLNTLIRHLDATNEGVNSVASARGPQEEQGGKASAKGGNGKATADISGNIMLEVNVKLDNEMLNSTIANVVQNSIERWVSVVINNPSGAASGKKG